MTQPTRAPARRLGVVDDLTAALVKIAKRNGVKIGHDAMRARLSGAWNSADGKSLSVAMTDIVEKPAIKRTKKS